jgi:hypothetical protein
MENVATYSEARSEYTKQLATFIVPSLVGWFQQLWQRNVSQRQQAMYLFQTECEEIARWNQDRIHDEVRALLERTGCDYMEELVTAVFIAHTKVLTAVRLSSQQKKLSITVPKLDHFIHRVFREAARSFWKSPFLFADGGAVIDRQKNVLQIEALATEAITTAVRSLLPVKQILQDYLDGGDDEELDEEDLAPSKAEVYVPATEMTTEPVKEEEAPAAVPVPEPIKEEASAPEPVKLEEEEEEEEKEKTPTLTVTDISSAEVPPSIMKIDTEAAVRFSDYDAVFDETKGAPEIRYTPKEEIENGRDYPDEEEDDDDDDLMDMPADGLLEIDEQSVADVSDEDVEDLEPVPKKLPPVFRESIESEDVEVLE